MPVGLWPAFLQVRLLNVKGRDVYPRQMRHHEGQSWLIFDFPTVANHTASRTAN
jgi:hypothetical protein